MNTSTETTTLPEKYNTYMKRITLVRKGELSFDTYESVGIPTGVDAEDAYLASLEYDSPVYEELEEILAEERNDV